MCARAKGAFLLGAGASILPRAHSQGTVPQQGHVRDGFSLWVFKTISSYPASSALVLSRFRKSPG
jgi:hypothetical protein